MELKHYLICGVILVVALFAIDSGINSTLNSMERMDRIADYSTSKYCRTCN